MDSSVSKISAGNEHLNNNHSFKGSNQVFDAFPASPAASAPVIVKDSFSRTEKDLKAAKRQNGLIEKTADFIKDKTGLGASARSIENDIKAGKKSEEQITLDIKNYRRSQENIMQASGDVFSAAASIDAFFKIKNWFELKKGKYIVEGGLKAQASDKFIKGKAPGILLGAAAAAAAGALVKYAVLRLNRIGTDQYKPEIDKDMKKYQVRTAKARSAREARGASLRNFSSGAVNGLAAPIMALGPWGAPLYAAVNSLNRYFIGTREDAGDKSLGSYIDNVKNSPIANTLAAASIMIPAVYMGKENKIFELNLADRIQVLTNAKLEPLEHNQTAYDKLEGILFSDTKISGLLSEASQKNTSNERISQIIEELSRENIFALKFKQITPDSDKLSAALKELCPPTRTIDEAEALIKKAFSGEYTINRTAGNNGLAGVGTVAESYFVKDKSGNEFCIKMLKQGINAKKITDDRDKFIKMIENSALENDEKGFLKKNLENIAEGVLKEIDLKNEMIAAQELAKVTKAAKIAVPEKITEDGQIYVMKKAKGISLQSLLKDKKKMQELSEDQSKELIDLYQDVIVEQFSKVNSKGKRIHGDIHPGNIFIDIDALKRGEKDCFTLIDTGNTIVQSAESARRFLNLSKYIENADITNISKFVLEGAKLPKDLKPEEAQKKVAEELGKIFFDEKTEIGHIDNKNLLVITDSILQKLNIVPSDTQGNLMKAQKSAETSLEGFTKVFSNIWSDKVNSELNEGKAVDAALGGMKGLYSEYVIKSNLAKKRKAQERMNFLTSPLEWLKSKRSKDAPKHNSKEYLTYVLKQYKPARGETNKIEAAARTAGQLMDLRNRMNNGEEISFENITGVIDAFGGNPPEELNKLQKILSSLGGFDGNFENLDITKLLSNLEELEEAGLKIDDELIEKIMQNPNDKNLQAEISKRMLSFMENLMKKQPQPPAPGK